jgi:hypothetical protein
MASLAQHERTHANKKSNEVANEIALAILALGGTMPEVEHKTT